MLGSMTGVAVEAQAAQAVNLCKTYGAGHATVRALDNVSVAFEHGRFTAVMGPSGSGKSTLMHCLAGLDRPTSGTVYVGGQDIGKLDDAGLTKLRRDRIGFVFQYFNLVPTLTAGENIALPVALAGRKPDQDWVDYLAKQLGIADRLSHRPSELSGGQQQRVACARALVNKPDLVFADEPTGNLDSTAAAEPTGLPPAVGAGTWPVGRHGDPRPAQRRVRRPGRLPRRRGRGERAAAADRRLGARADTDAGGMTCAR